jgi:VWFA-related protein
LTLPKSEAYTQRVKTGRLLASAAVVFSIGLLCTLTPSAQAPRRSIYASVLDKDGAVVPNLGPADFIVREDNRTREILSVEPATAPMQVALLVDNSARSSPSIRDIRDATNEFIKGMTSGVVRNEMVVVAVAERPTVLVDYTADQPKLLAGAGRIFTQSNSGAYLLDGLLEISQGFKKREASRPVIVAISTNGPELSNRYHDQIISALRGVNATFSVVMVGPPPTDVISSEGRERALTLSQGTEATGGRYDNVLAASALAGRLKQVANELTHQYLVTYARPDTLIPPERITITGKDTSLTVRGIPVSEKGSGRGR